MAATPTRLRLPVWAQDLLLAGFIAFLQVQGTRQIPTTEQRLAEIGDVGLYLHAVLLVLTGLVLAVRRRWPIPVFLIVATANLFYYLAGYPDGPAWLGVFVALYTVAAYADDRWVRWVTNGGVVMLTAGWLAAAVIHPPAEAGWWFFRLGTAIMAAVLGYSVRMRRDLAAQAQERAERAERTKEEEARRRVDAERLRIAREVHDTVAHAIAVINVHAGVTAHVMDKRPQQARETLLTIEQTSARALRELRATLGVLRGDDADEHRAPAPGLDRIEELAAVAREAGLDVKVETPTPPRELPAAVNTAAYRILQESITNAIRHAGPARLIVSVMYGPHDLGIRITDNGRGGACPDDAGGSGVSVGRGIAGMRERCALLGGQLTAGPLTEGGFEVYARLPLPAEGAS
jgi:signal transduction histidine kinase